MTRLLHRCLLIASLKEFLTIFKPGGIFDLSFVFLFWPLHQKDIK